MPWSNFYELNSENIERVPERTGIYRIALLEESSAFHLKWNESESNYEWIGIYAEHEIPKLTVQRFLDTRTLVGFYYKEIYSNLVYIGKSDNLNQRLNEHLAGRGSSGVQQLLLNGVDLRFSYLSTRDGTVSENNFYQEFLEETGGFCPPCDKNSNECLRFSGNYVPTYLLKKRGRGIQSILVC